MNLVACIFILISFGCAAFIVNCEPAELYWQIISSNFIISYLGIILGLSLTMVVNIYNIIDKLRDKLCIQYENKKIDKNKLDLQLNLVDSLFNELRQDITAVFFILIFIFVLITLEVINIPIVSELIKVKNIKILMLGSFLLANFIVYDILTALFKIIKASNVKQYY